MRINIDNLTENELIELNHRIVERLKFLDSMRAHAEMMEFSIGEKIRFRRRGEEVVGILAKYNKKTVTVITEEGQTWNVSPHLIEKTKAGKRTVRKSGNVIELKPK